MRVMTITKEVYTFEELDESAKEKAREWWRKGALDYDWWQWTYDDFERICEVLGVEIAQNRPNINHGKGKQLWFSGFYSQGDGACFAGTYTYKKGSCKAIRALRPMDEELHRIADTLRDLQRVVFYDAYVSITQDGRYSHPGTMSASIEPYAEVAYPQISNACYFPTAFQEKLTDDFLEALRDLAHWLYRTLEREHDYLLSDESVDESIRINEYEFTSDGRIA